MKWKTLNQFCAMALAALPLCGYSQSNTTPADASAAAPAAATAPAPAATNAPAPFVMPLPANVAEVVKLTKAGMGEDVVLAYVKNSPSPYNLQANDIINIKAAGVSPTVISAMLAHDSAMQTQAQNAPPPAGPYVYNQQLYPPTGQYQPQPVQPIAQSPLAQAQAPAGPPPPDMSAAQPPPPQPDVIPVAPGPDYYWAPGYWGWNGGWIWIGGGWYPRGYYGWGYRGWGYRGGWGGYRGGVGFRGGHR